VELMESNMPLPVVQQILGHATPGLAASYIAFSGEEMRETAKDFIERENRRKTSARNRFYGKIRSVRKGDIQSILELATLGGYELIAVITNDSLERLNLRPGSPVTAEIKAPWVILLKGENPPVCTAENRFPGKVARVLSGETTTELGVRLSDGTELCAIVTNEQDRFPGIQENDFVWAVFNAFSVILHID
jgi:molybdate transport system regulatory protein